MVEGLIWRGNVGNTCSCVMGSDPGLSDNKNIYNLYFNVIYVINIYCLSASCPRDIRHRGPTAVLARKHVSLCAGLGRTVSFANLTKPFSYR